MGKLQSLVGGEKRKAPLANEVILDNLSVDVEIITDIDGSTSVVVEGSQEIMTCIEGTVLRIYDAECATERRGEATGSRGVVCGGNIEGATIVTGNNNVVSGDAPSVIPRMNRAVVGSKVFIRTASDVKVTIDGASVSGKIVIH